MNVAKYFIRFVGNEHFCIHSDRLFLTLRVFLASAMVLILLSGCTKTLSGLTKSQEKTNISSSQSTLIKPKLDSVSDVDTPPENTNELSNKPTQQIEKELTTGNSEINQSLDSKKSLPDKNRHDSQDEQFKPTKRLTGSEQVDFPEEKDQKRGDKPTPPVRSKAVTDEDDMLGSEIEDRNPDFKKHDHAKYVAKIKNAAIDVVNREVDSIYARMCRNTTTDEWSLGLYFVQGKNYYFRTYVWDPIENVWTETFESEKRLYAGIKKHLSFSSAGKKCMTLKGSDKE